LWTVSGIDPELLLDHLSGGDGTDTASTVHPDHDEVVEIYLLAFTQFIEPHHIAALHNHCDLHVFCAVEIFLYQLGHEEGPAVEGSCDIFHLFGVRDYDGDGIIKVLSLLDRKHGVHQFGLQGKFQQAGNCSSALCFLRDLCVGCPRIDHISF